jgi:hypothetical protein
VSSCPTAPGSSMPVTTLTAASTPIAVCGCTGMNERVPTWPPSRGGASSASSAPTRRHVAEAHQLPALRRKASIRSSSGLSAASCSCDSYAGQSERLRPSRAPPASRCRRRSPRCRRSRPARAGGQQAPGRRPSVSVNARTTGAAVPGNARDRDVAAVLDPAPRRRERWRRRRCRS